MPRIARVVVPGLAHHVTQRGNRRADVFFDKPDRHRYLSVLGAYAERHGVAIWAYCLMSNHVHFVAVPTAADSLGRKYRDAHRPSMERRRIHQDLGIDPRPHPAHPQARAEAETKTQKAGKEEPVVIIKVSVPETLKPVPETRP